MKAVANDKEKEISQLSTYMQAAKLELKYSARDVAKCNTTLRAREKELLLLKEDLRRCTSLKE
jgi:hypothetical protein